MKLTIKKIEELLEGYAGIKATYLGVFMDKNGAQETPKRFCFVKYSGGLVGVLESDLLKLIKGLNVSN